MLVDSSTALLPFFGEGSPSKIDYRKKTGTLILTSLLEDLVQVEPTVNDFTGAAQMVPTNSTAEAPASACSPRSAPSSWPSSSAPRRCDSLWARIWCLLIGCHGGVVVFYC